MVTKRQDAADAVTLTKRAAEARLAEQQAAVGRDRGTASCAGGRARGGPAHVGASRAGQAGRHRGRPGSGGTPGRGQPARALPRRRQQSVATAVEAAVAAAAVGRRRRPQGRGGSSSGTSTGAQAAIDYARAQIGKPYEWGADGPRPVRLLRADDARLAAGRRQPAALQRRAVRAGPEGRARATCAPATWSSSAATSPTTTASTTSALYIGGGDMIEAPYTGANVRISSIWRSSLFGAARP